MAVLPKIPRLPASLMSIATGGVDFPAAAVVSKNIKLDFAANPNRYHTNGNGKVKKAKPLQGPRIDLTPRLELGLNVQCDVVQEQDSEMDM